MLGIKNHGQILLQNKAVGLLLCLFNVRFEVPATSYIDYFVLYIDIETKIQHTEVLMKEKAKY